MQRTTAVEPLPHLQENRKAGMHMYEVLKQEGGRTTVSGQGEEE